ncbi:MAG: lamin tail domain-containing protein, partial [Phycisphaerales bacterium]|nr:lamin tail domain-containing protein [Phycisphaerales bacterium]
QCFVADRTLCLQTGGVVFGVVPDGTSTCSSTQCVPAPVRISQIYVSGGQTGATYRNDFVELFNSSSSPVDVSGWALQYASTTGQFTQRVDFPAATSIPARSYFLVRLGGTATPGAGATYSGDFNPTTTYDMGASGRLALVTAATPSPFQLAICPGLPRANVADYVGWGDGVACFEGTPIGVSPGPVTALYRIVNGCTDTDRNFNDFVANALTPTLRTTANSFDCSTAATLPGACCAGNLTCSLTTSAACTGSFLGEGTVCSSTVATTPNACGTPIGRCCIALQSCTATLTEQQCRDAAIAAGLADYVSFSAGSTCSSGSGSTLVSNLCVGVCCTGAVCTLTTRDQCVGDTAFWASNTQGIQGVGSNPVTCSTNICQTPAAAQAGDIVYGASVSQNYDSAVQYRDTGSGPVRVGTLTRYNNVQYFAFDNAFNSPKNARGNLLAMDFGTVGGGATIFNVATNGSINAGQVLYRLQAGNALNPY